MEQNYKCYSSAHIYFFERLLSEYKDFNDDLCSSYGDDLSNFMQLKKCETIDTIVSMFDDVFSSNLSLDFEKIDYQAEALDYVSMKKSLRGES